MLYEIITLDLTPMSKLKSLKDYTIAAVIILTIVVILTFVFQKVRKVAIQNEIEIAAIAHSAEKFNLYSSRKDCILSFYSPILNHAEFECNGETTILWIPN